MVSFSRTCSRWWCSFPWSRRSCFRRRGELIVFSCWKPRSTCRWDSRSRSSACWRRDAPQGWRSDRPRRIPGNQAGKRGLTLVGMEMEISHDCCENTMSIYKCLRSFKMKQWSRNLFCLTPKRCEKPKTELQMWEAKYESLKATWTRGKLHENSVFLLLFVGWFESNEKLNFKPIWATKRAKFFLLRLRLAKDCFCFIKLFFPLLHNWFPLLATAVGSHTTSFKKKKKQQTFFGIRKFPNALFEATFFAPLIPCDRNINFLLNWT